MSKWADAGLVNIQVWASQKVGKPAEVTCKQETTKDHLYLSPQLAMYLKDVEVQHDWFADHWVLIARFHPLGNPPLLPLWKYPAPIDWSAVTQEEVSAQLMHLQPNADPTIQYAQLMSSGETAVDKALKRKGKAALPSQAKGRGQQLEVV